MRHKSDMNINVHLTLYYLIIAGVQFSEDALAHKNGYADSGQGTSHTDDEEELDLLYDPVLNCYYDPTTYKYYELA